MRFIWNYSEKCYTYEEALSKTTVVGKKLKQYLTWSYTTLVKTSLQNVWLHF